MPTSGSGAPLKITKELLLEIGGWRAMKEGLALWESGKVVSVAYEPPLLYGIVQTGTTTVNARLNLGYRLSDVENLCSCRQAREYGTVCAHVIALGLEYMNPHRESQGQGVVIPIPSLGHNPTAQLPAPSLRRVRYLSFSDAPDSAQLLQLSILLPVKFQEAWNSGEMRIICEGSVNGAHAVPLENFVGEEKGSHAVSEADSQILDVIRRLNNNGTPGMWVLNAKNFGDFFSSLVEHPRVMLGKTSKLLVKRAIARSRLQMSLHQDGQLHLNLKDDAMTSGVVLQASTGQWKFHDGSLELLNGLPMSYVSLRKKDIIIAREHLAHFFHYELSYLERQVDIILGLGCGELQFAKQKPEVSITLDGMLSGLSCKVEAIYGDRRYLIQGAISQVSHDRETWKPDDKNPMRYFIRDQESEQKIRAEILASGFVPGQRQKELYTLSNESRVGFFLANLLPKWSKRWTIEFTPRLEDLLSKCDRIMPEVTVNSFGENWLSMDICYKETSGKVALSNGEVQNLLKTGVSHQRMNSGRIALLPTHAVNEFDQVISDCQVQQEDGMYKIDRRFASYLGSALNSYGWALTSKSTWTPPSNLTDWEHVALKKELEVMLRPYQKSGVNWLHHLSRNSMCGILADEMGLGKTLQTLAYLQYRRTANPGKGPFLIVCPTSLVLNWEDEAKKFTPDLKVLVLHGAKRQTHFEKIKEVDLVVTSYALLRRDIDLHKGIHFDVVVLDEAQQIKNKSSQNAACTKMLKADYRIVLTGTPIENSLLDLWSIYDFLMPSYLGSAADFKRRYELPISKQNDEATQKRLRQRVRPFILRRTKSEVAKELPAKLEQVAFCELTDEQKGMYQRILEQGRRNVFDCAAGKGNDKEKGRLAVLTALMRLRQVCCHLNLLPTEQPVEWKEPSAKMDYFLQLMEQAVDGGHRILVFSQFVSMLKLVEAELKKKQITYCYLDGSTVDRKGVIKRFQADDKIPLFLISLKAGGTGINLTGADMVIHFDPWWNPAVEDQATARAHRIGQTRMVNSYKLIARGTVEEKIVNLQKKKIDLVANTLVSEEAFIQNLSWEELQGLLE
ncbi:MAG: SNF2-related protein [Blastochloris sp.]|jgi:superfamily II DNA or RNA helicase|nr:SNF2-related protein [Blastochloris sp.]